MTHEEKLVAFEALLAQGTMMQWKIALRFMKNEADADDCVQDALLAAYQKIDQWRGDASIKTWFTSIVLNQARQNLRCRDSANFKACLPLDDEIARDLRCKKPNAEQVLLQEEKYEIISKTVEALPAVLYETIKLSIVLELSVSQIMRRKRISIPAAKSRLYRARRLVITRVRTQMQNEQCYTAS